MKFRDNITEAKEYFEKLRNDGFQKKIHENTLFIVKTLEYLICIVFI